MSKTIIRVGRRLGKRALCESFKSPRNASLGSPGVDELRWLAPVRPGDRLRVRVAVQEALPSRSRPDRGSVRSLMETLNQRDEVVMTVRGTLLFRRRPATGG